MKTKKFHLAITLIAIIIACIMFVEKLHAEYNKNCALDYIQVLENSLDDGYMLDVISETNEYFNFYN